MLIDAHLLTYISQTSLYQQGKRVHIHTQVADILCSKCEPYF